MKKYFFMAMATLVVSAAAVVGVKSYNYYSMPELMKANLEALSQDGETDIKHECYDRFSLYSNLGTLKRVRVCETCDYKYVYKPRRKSICPL